MMEGRRFFLKSLLGASVAYCFLPSIPILGEEASEVCPCHPDLHIDQELTAFTLSYLPNILVMSPEAYALLSKRVPVRRRRIERRRS